MEAEPRTARVVVSCGAAWLGALGPYEMSTGWWADVEPVVARLEHELGVPTTVLRVVDVEGGAAPAGGLVTYHAEVDRLPMREPGWQPIEDAQVEALSATQPQRTAHARPGGPAAHLRWAEGVLHSIGRPRTGWPTQVKTWNLSMVHRIPAVGGPVWLKCVSDWQPPENLAIEAVATVDPGLVPVVLGGDPVNRRLLLDHVPGEDAWQPSEVALQQGLRRWVAVQSALRDPSSPGRRLARGLPDWTFSTLADRLVAALVDDPSALPAVERGLLGRLLDDLPSRLADLAEAGLPDTLVHGDFHTGNWRFDGTDVVIVDWSDAAIGHPAIDLVCLLARLAPDRWGRVADGWTTSWQAAVPGSDPARAVALVQPLQPLQAALLYQHFLDHIEPSERRYHEGDPADMVRLAAGRAGLLD